MEPEALVCGPGWAAAGGGVRTDEVISALCGRLIGRANEKNAFTASDAIAEDEWMQSHLQHRAGSLSPAPSAANNRAEGARRSRGEVRSHDRAAVHPSAEWMNGWMNPVGRWRYEPTGLGKA